MIKQTLILSLLFLPLVSITTANIAEAIPTNGQYQYAQVGDYKLFMNTFLVNGCDQLKDISYNGVNGMSLHAQNNDKSNNIIFYQNTCPYWSYRNSVLNGAVVGGAVASLADLDNGTIGKYMLGCMAVGAGLGAGVCAFVNRIESKRLEISVLDCTKDKKDHYQYTWVSRPGRDRTKQMKLFAIYWIQKYKCNQGEALDALMNKTGLFLDAQGRVYKRS